MSALRVLDPAARRGARGALRADRPRLGRVGPVVYIDALLAGMPPPVRDAAIDAIDALSPPSLETLEEKQFTPEFQFVRALAIEAYYSDFVEPGRDAEGAWAEIDFDPPAARRLRKDWSWLLG